LTPHPLPARLAVNLAPPVQLGLTLALSAQVVAAPRLLNQAVAVLPLLAQVPVALAVLAVPAPSHPGVVNLAPPKVPFVAKTASSKNGRGK